MIDGFGHSFVQTGDVRLSVHRAGSGTPLILLHGYPQNHHCWEHVAPTLAQDFDVIIPDLRGYGDSDAPPDDASHSTYSKRQMANDVAGLMDALGIGQAHVLGHDRGGRVAYRFALDHPERLLKLGIIEIVPTGDFWANWTADLALKAYHWTFLAQPEPLPERMIGADPVGYIDWTLGAWTRSRDLSAFSDAALESSRAQARDPARIHAMCGDYRAGATFDRALDEADKAAGRQIDAPLHFLWAETGFPAQTGDPAALWRSWAPQVTDSSCQSGHFAMEEVPEQVLAAFRPFFGS
ncbi:alpha/beta fold hydrolase [Flavimaricola marinus]|uniref:Fluoroacetate dehalogenase n=1 Tax=Flavimaricola marinus TaxID=1819565 RepID=A0A238LHW4_9RHOB|nr:alpha/beta hydrolase [Flavimaricola marinus]SMY08985.1 Fluoroacetate dehalogenase [Flavimaricola marinus]